MKLIGRSYKQNCIVALCLYLAFSVAFSHHTFGFGISISSVYRLYLEGVGKTGSNLVAKHSACKLSCSIFCSPSFAVRVNLQSFARCPGFVSLSVAQQYGQPTSTLCLHICLLWKLLFLGIPSRMFSFSLFGSHLLSLLWY